MSRPSNRLKILTEGLRVVHERGFGAASVRDIVQAAGVPQGSFTNHFVSKEAFGLEILDLYFASACVVMGETLRNDARAPLERLAAWIDTNIEFLSPDDMRRGCLIGNFTAEASEHSDAIRHRLIEMFTGTKNAVAYCLEAAVKAGEVPAGTDCDTVAAFIVEAMQGANLVAKAERSPAPVERFKRILFSKVLH